MTNRGSPLAGLTVLDLTRLLPGPAATLHLADLGAEVIKIEDTGLGDYARSLGAGAAAANQAGEDSPFFKLLNRNKRSLRLDLKRSEGIAVFLRLAATADVIVEGFRPGVVDKLGIGYDAVKALNPRIVYCAISGYGQNGPWRERAGHDINYIATAGVLDQIGVKGQAPALPNFQIGDLLGGALTSLVGLLAAVFEAKTTGQGRYIDVAMTDAVFAHAYSAMLVTLERGSPAARGDDLLSGGVPCYGVYRTADKRYLAVGALEPKFWELLCAAIDRPDLVPYGLASGRQGEWTKEQLTKLIATRPLAHWADVFNKVDCCVTPVLTLDEAMCHPHLVARGMVSHVGGMAQFAPPYQSSDFALAAAQPAPAAGQHSAALLAEAGFSNTEIAALRDSGVI
ncbi:MAG: CaiB/BaiF CoA-transferase family protein [Proteobacteria bacterium]|nr:CaiB/BaiF CoA-transferase family protein [Pseudomonadota bacterium]